MKIIFEEKWLPEYHICYIWMKQFLLINKYMNKMETNTPNSADFSNEDYEKQNENSNTSIKKVIIPEYAYAQAGLHQGDSTSLIAHLVSIKEGHLVDESFSEQEHLLGKKKAENSIQEKESEKIKLEADKNSVNDVKIPAAKNLIDETKEEIKLVNINVAENRIKSDFQPMRYYTYLALTVLLSFYLLFFYASAINSAFFRNAQSLIANAGADITMLLDSIFDPKGIFKLSSSMVFTYFGAFLFFSIGLLPHGIINGEGKRKNLFAGLLIAGAFLADAAIAYKIDKGIHDLKLMAGVPDADWKFYSSINFYLVLLFGFCAYLVWGQMYELVIKEKNKKNTDSKAKIIIDGLKETMKEQKLDLQLLEMKVKQLEAEITIIKQQLEKLKKDLETAMVNPDELARNLASFYKGWRQFLMGSTEFENQRKECDSVYKDFIGNLFIKVPQSLN